MAVLSFYETFDQRLGRINNRYEREYVRTFKVLCSARTDGPETIRFSRACPRPWSFYWSASGAADLGSWCKDLEFRQDALDPYTWHVRAVYSSVVERPDIHAENPLLRPAVVSWGHTSVMKPLEFDNVGQAITSSSKERFDPPPEIEDVRMTLRIQRNQIRYDALFYAGYLNSVNDDTWLTFPPGMVRCMGIEGTRQYESGILFWDVTFNFQIKAGYDPEENGADAWAFRLLDRGFYSLDNAGKQVRLFDKLGQPLTTPALLDGAGAKLAVGADPKFRTYWGYKNKVFRELLPL